MTKIVISGYYGFKNFGDETILSILTKHLKILNTDITVFSSDTQFTKNTYNVHSVYTFDIKQVINTIKESDILISGGGSLLQDVTGFKSLLYYAFVIFVALIFKKKVIIFAQGIGPLKRNLSQIIVKNLLKKCSYISVRDEKSLNLLKAWNINADLVNDPVFSLNIEHKPAVKAVGIQLREFKNVNDKFLNSLAQFVNAKFSDYKIEIFSLQNKYDLDISKTFESILKKVNQNIKTEIISDNIIENISQLEYLFAMRFHAILIAIKAGIKTCAINYDIKVEQLADNAGIPIINPNENQNFETIFNELTNLNSSELINFSNEKTFDWTKIDMSVNHPVS